ncbi:MAG: flagellar export chaperone FliS [Burkholderiales bacterium]|nr:flagellar export chaperone FliS [Burkholderiales bacterium]MDE2275949.1 flagellar export chaperone FliS [Burkholderiales bacterium]
MFTSPYARRSTAAQSFGDLYQQVGIESQLDGATPHHLVAMLFEGFMEALAQARGAMRERQFELKGRAIRRATSIVEEGLRGGLDLRAGGTLARDLDALYLYLCQRLTLANLHNDESALDECQRLMRPLQDAWREIGSRPAARA